MRSDHHNTELHRGGTVNQRPLPAANQEQLVIVEEEGGRGRGGGVSKDYQPPTRGEAAADGRREESRPTAENSWTSEHRNMVVELEKGGIIHYNRVYCTYRIILLLIFFKDVDEISEFGVADQIDLAS